MAKKGFEEPDLSPEDEEALDRAEAKRDKLAAKKSAAQSKTEAKSKDTHNVRQ